MISSLAENNLHVYILMQKIRSESILKTFLPPQFPEDSGSRLGKIIQRSPLECGLEQRPNTRGVIFSTQILSDCIF